MYLKKTKICKTSSIKAKVDDKPPKLEISTLYKTRNLLSDAMRVRELDKENLELLQKLNTITRQQAPVDCWNLKIKYKSEVEDEESAKRWILEENKALLQRLRNAVSQYSAKIYLQEWKNMQLKLQRTKNVPMELKKPVKENKDICMVNNPSVLDSMQPSIRKKCYFEITVLDTKQILGNIIFKLYTDLVPKTSANFEAFCRGTNGLSYKNTSFHRIVPGYWCQGGDVTMFSGAGGTSIYGDYFENENFDLRHGTVGVLSTCNTESRVDSKFNLTFKCLETMDGKRTVFGKVVAGFATLHKIESFGTRSGKPIKSVIVSNCGVL